MGLDISYYKNLTPVECTVARTEGCDHVHVYQDKAFVGREAPLVNGKCYDGESVGGFRAGSYSGYSNFRDSLAALAGYKPTGSPPHRFSQSAWDATEGPFWELINFSDAEGTIGADASKKLAADFAQFGLQARNALDEYAWGKYCEWRKAFETAAEGGAVRFH